MRNLEKIGRSGGEPTAGTIACRIRDRITDGTFQPGMRLGEARLARDFDVSRGPVREALQRLVQEGLLRNERNRGVFVAFLDEEDILDIYRARAAIERVAALSLARRGDKETFEELEGLVGWMSTAAGENDWASCSDLDLRFHEALVRSSGSKRLQRMFGTLLGETRMCLAALESAYPIREDLVEEHRSLLAAMRRGDEREVAGLVRAHLQDAVDDLTGGRADLI